MIKQLTKAQAEGLSKEDLKSASGGLLWYDERSHGWEPWVLIDENSREFVRAFQTREEAVAAAEGSGLSTAEVDNAWVSANMGVDDSFWNMYS